MYCTRKVLDDLTWIGSNDRRLALFEGTYPIPRGVSYNSYLLTDDKTVLFDTVDQSVTPVFLENIAHTLAGRDLDYVLVQHMEPDHSAALQDVLLHYPNAKILCNKKTSDMILRFFSMDLEGRFELVDESSVVATGHHELHFVFAPMVHWPEVMVTYDAASKTLFSADAFGTFGALNGALFADEVDFDRDYLDEARRYYCNIVGMYGPQVQAVLGKAGALDIAMICPLHGFVWRTAEDIGYILDKYLKWSSYTPEEKGVVIAYGSIYGNTANAADILACKLRERGVVTTVYDVSVTHNSELVAAAFRWSHLVLAAPTYNGGVFVEMDAFLRDLAEHKIQNRTVALMQNGAWGPISAKQMRAILEPCKNMTFLDPVLTIKAALKDNQAEELDALADAVAASLQA